ncbi:MAG: NTP transferase domain-containing protein [Vicinamibacteria bacterium]|nr:NTP transferase domain-containing protein [Vicinamibacteria bacterium]
MRYALIMAGGAGTRLWPMSRVNRPKQFVPFIEGRSLLQLTYARLEGLIPAENRYVCAGRRHADLVRDTLDLPERQLLAEPVGRDTLNAVGLGVAVIAKRDPEAVVAVFTSDHVIEPIDRFQRIVGRGFRLAETTANTLVTFGVTPNYAAICYGYLHLGESIEESARLVRQFKEKPDAETAGRYFAEGPERYLWNSGMFVWRADTLLDCIRRYEPESFAGLTRIIMAWDTPEKDGVLSEVFPTLKKDSIDYAVMEKASNDPNLRVAAVPMPLKWLDVGSWPMFAETCDKDKGGNAVGAAKSLLLDTRGTIVATSDPGHLIATIGCDDLIVVHTPDATLVCRKDRAEVIKDLHRLVDERFGPEVV